MFNRKEKLEVKHFQALWEELKQYETSLKDWDQRLMDRESKLDAWYNRLVMLEWHQRRRDQAEKEFLSLDTEEIRRRIEPLFEKSLFENSDISNDAWLENLMKLPDNRD